MNLDRIAEKALESNAGLVITVSATRILLFGAVCKVPRAKLNEIILTSESASGSIHEPAVLRQRGFWIRFAADKIATNE